MRSKNAAPDGADAVLVGEPTGHDTIEIGQKGILHTTLTAKGTPGHGSTGNYKGDNAITKLCRVLVNIDDLTKVANGAMGALTGMKDEVEARVRDQIAKILDGMDIPRRDEFDAVKAMAAKAREENEELKKQIADLQTKLEGR